MKHNLELEDNKPSSSLNQLEETTNNNTLDPDEPENIDHDLMVVFQENNYEDVGDEALISTPDSAPITRPSARKRKADQLIDSSNIDKENTPPPKKTTRSTNRKRR